MAMDGIDRGSNSFRPLQRAKRSKSSKSKVTEISTDI